MIAKSKLLRLKELVGKTIPIVEWALEEALKGNRKAIVLLGRECPAKLLIEAGIANERGCLLRLNRAFNDVCRRLKLPSMSLEDTRPHLEALLRN